VLLYLAKCPISGMHPAKTDYSSYILDLPIACLAGWKPIMEQAEAVGSTPSTTGRQIGMLLVMAQQKEQNTMRPKRFARNWMAPVGDPAGTRFRVSAHSL
jgi:hypothetical protein